MSKLSLASAAVVALFAAQSFAASPAVDASKAVHKEGTTKDDCVKGVHKDGTKCEKAAK